MLPKTGFSAALRVKLQKLISMDFCAFLFTPAENDGMINETKNWTRADKPAVQHPEGENQ